MWPRCARVGARARSAGRVSRPPGRASRASRGVVSRSIANPSRCVIRRFVQSDWREEKTACRASSSPDELRIFRRMYGLRDPEPGAEARAQPVRVEAEARGVRSPAAELSGLGLHHDRRRRRLLDPQHHHGVARAGAPVPGLAAVDTAVSRPLREQRERRALLLVERITDRQLAAPIRASPLRSAGGQDGRRGRPSGGPDRGTHPRGVRDRRPHRQPPDAGRSAVPTPA